MSKHFVISAVAVIPPSTLQLSYADGQHFVLDLACVIDRFPALARLSTPSVFASAEIGDGGMSIIWDGDDELELAADNLRARAIEQADGFSHEFIWNWMAKNQLTLDDAARAIGVSRRMLAYYRSGKNPVPRTVALACIGWEAGKKLAA
ncbi:hypothetical protein AGMMS50256_05990 [Betaproteobacteria bacterium]|nr:hypothetical protein AGMMS50256_05990 [Betaproteobacteria bacterium]